MSDGDGSPQRGTLGRMFSNEWLAPGLLFMAVGGFGLWVSRTYEMGDVNQMGPGWFPRALCIGLVGLGALIAWRGLFDRTMVQSRGSASRGFVLVILSMALFSLTIEGTRIPFTDLRLPSLGFVGALTLTLLVSSMAHRGQKWTEVISTVALIVVTAVLIFSIALKLPFRLWPEL